MNSLKHIGCDLKCVAKRLGVEDSPRSCSVRGEPLGGDWTINTSDVGRRLVHGWISLEGGSELEEVGLLAGECL